MKKLTCHCGGVEAEVNVSEKFEKVIRCNCSICKRKGYLMTPVSPENFKLLDDLAEVLGAAVAASRPADLPPRSANPSPA